MIGRPGSRLSLFSGSRVLGKSRPVPSSQPIFDLKFEVSCVESLMQKCIYHKCLPVHRACMHTHLMYIIDGYVCVCMHVCWGWQLFCFQVDKGSGITPDAVLIVDIKTSHRTHVARDSFTLRHILEGQFSSVRLWRAYWSMPKIQPVFIFFSPSVKSLLECLLFFQELMCLKRSCVLTVIFLHMSCFSSEFCFCRQAACLNKNILFLPS